MVSHCESRDNFTRLTVLSWMHEFVVLGHNNNTLNTTTQQPHPYSSTTTTSHHTSCKCHWLENKRGCVFLLRRAREAAGVRGGDAGRDAQLHQRSGEGNQRVLSLISPSFPSISLSTKPMAMRSSGCCRKSEKTNQLLLKLVEVDLFILPPPSLPSNSFFIPSSSSASSFPALSSTSNRFAGHRGRVRAKAASGQGFLSFPLSARSHFPSLRFLLG